MFYTQPTLGELTSFDGVWLRLISADFSPASVVLQTPQRSFLVSALVPQKRAINLCGQEVDVEV